jgi:pyruvate kinase
VSTVGASAAVEPGVVVPGTGVPVPATPMPVVDEQRTKIVATVGPASDSHEVLVALIRAGVDVFRLNLSHGKLPEHLERLARVQAARDEVGYQVAILADLPGPKIRAGSFGESGITVVPGDQIQMRPGSDPSGSSVIFVEYPGLIDDLRAGDRIALGDGDITLGVDSVEPDHVRATFRTGGRLRGKPGVHLPGDRLQLRTPTAEDLVFAVAMAQAGVEFLAVSFVRAAQDLVLVREAVVAAGLACPALVAKIETRGAVEQLDPIIEQADAVMVARGDLGIDCPLEDVPHLQKKIIRACVEAAVPVITATQMLESMVRAPAPTRAEVSDVANAVFDGTDAVMLSGETAIGDHPVLVVETMSRIVSNAEREASYRQWGSRLGRVQRRRDTEGQLKVTQAITHAAWMASEAIQARVIVCCTLSGRTARAMARFRPLATLVAASPDPMVARQLALSWGVLPVIVDSYDSTDELVWQSVERVVAQGLASPGDHVLVLAGDPRSGYGSTDVMRVVVVR